MGKTLDTFIELRKRIDLTIKEIESAIGTVYESQVPTAKVGPMVSAHAGFMENLTGQLESGKINIAQFDAQVQAGIQTNFTQAYAAGKGVKISDLTDGDVEFLRRASQAEFEFAAQFGRDIESGGLIMSRVDRANMYGGAVNGMAWNGMVEGMPDDARIGWVLGVAEHCLDCISLSMSSPFNRWNLPTTPGAGATACRGNCQCRLVAITGPMTKDEKAQAAKYGSARDQGVKDMLDVSPPKGLRLPNNIEQDYIDSLRNEINFERRRIAKLNPSSKEFKQAVSHRSQLNGELIEFIEQESIFEVPVYSVDEVITAADIGVKAQGDIMLTGLDGGSLSVISDKQLDAMVNRYETTVGEGLPKDSSAAKKAAKKKKKK